MKKQISKHKKQNLMSKSTSNGKGKGHKNVGEFHYFALDAVVNGDGTVTVSFSQNEPIPEGMIIKTISVLRRNGAVDPNGTITWDGIIQIGGFGPFNTGDRELQPQSLTDTPPIAGTYTYNISGTYGVAGDNMSQLLLGSNWVVVTV